MKAAPRVLAALLLIGAAVVALRSSAGMPAYPLKPSLNGRYLVDQANVPVLIAGDSPQALIVNLTTNDAAMPIIPPTPGCCRTINAQTSSRPSWWRPTMNLKTCRDRSPRRRSCAGRNTGR